MTLPLLSNKKRTTRVQVVRLLELVPSAGTNRIRFYGYDLSPGTGHPNRYQSKGTACGHMLSSWFFS